MQHHKYSLAELENMLPWERDIYVGMLINYIEEENEKAKQRYSQMVENIRDAYKERIAKLSWMTDSTKKKA